ncbi:unnamed protein product [Cochlearia groenlandica]
MADFYSLFLLFITFLVSLLIILAIIVRPKPIKIPIKSRHVFITGGSSGIGLALANLAASEGARVSILDRSAEKLADAKRSIELSTGVGVAAFSADVCDYDAVSNINELGMLTHRKSGKEEGFFLFLQILRQKRY